MQRRGTALVRDGIQPADIAQGALGDCWLLAAAACLAEFPGVLQNLFEQTHVSPRGKYALRLWDVVGQAWMRVCVDDFFPCDSRNGQPLFAQPADGELWVLLLEKAFAKYCGSYGELQGGLTLWALHVMTGDHCFSLKREASQRRWKRLDLVSMGTREQPRKCGLRATAESFGGEELWSLLLGYDRAQAVLGASISSGGGEERRSDGLVAGHAYAVLQCREVLGVRLMQLRNPWGAFEWRGDWSDHSSKWTEQPEIKEALWPERRSKEADGWDDGAFWMGFDDFCALFTLLDVCDRTTGVRDLAFALDEDDGCLRGPACACARGCARFWCLCHGPRALYWGHQSSRDTMALPKRSCRCLERCNGGEPVLL